MFRPNSPALPFLMACIGIASFSVMDGVMKSASIALGAYNAMFWRQLIGIVLAGTLFVFQNQGWPKSDVLRIHVIRGTISAFMAVSFFYGIVRVPLAEGIALSFIAPLITLYLAALLLKEKITPRSIGASLIALSGVGVILAGRLGAETYDKDVLWGIGAIFISALLYSYNLILQRQQAQVAKPAEVAFFQSLIGASVLGLAAPFWAVVPASAQWGALTVSSALAIFSLLLLSWAYARAEAQILVTVEYTAFVWAAIFGWIFFREVVTLPMLAGTLLIVTGCIIAALQKKPGQVDHIESSAL